jgi:hypothetical protein
VKSSGGGLRRPVGLSTPRAPAGNTRPYRIPLGTPLQLEKRRHQTYASDVAAHRPDIRKQRRVGLTQPWRFIAARLDVMKNGRSGSPVPNRRPARLEIRRQARRRTRPDWRDPSEQAGSALPSPPRQSRAVRDLLRDAMIERSRAPQCCVRRSADRINLLVKPVSTMNLVTSVRGAAKSIRATRAGRPTSTHPAMGSAVVPATAVYGASAVFIAQLIRPPTRTCPAPETHFPG